MDNSSRLKVYSFFAGLGFLDLGFENAGYSVQFVNEIHAPFLRAYQHARKQLNLPPPAHGYYQGSIDDLLCGEQHKKLLSAVKADRVDGKLVGFIGGPPCPDFSIAGKNRGATGENGRLSASYVELICKCKPDFFLFENVKGLWRTKKHREFYDSLCRKLGEAGYKLSDKLINSLDYGAPQDRERIILIGHRLKSKKMPDWKIANQSHAENLLSRRGADVSKKIPTNLSVAYWFRRNKVDAHPNAEDHFQPRAALPKFKTITEGDVSRKSFKRLHRHRFSPTAAYGNNEVHIHPVLPRRISAAEALAIQSLPKEFVLPLDMTLTDKFKGVGNGVPYLAAYGVASMMKDVLGEDE